MLINSLGRSRKSSQEIETKSVNLGNLLGNLLSEEYKSKVSSWKKCSINKVAIVVPNGQSNHGLSPMSWIRQVNLVSLGWPTMD